tara:strand:+ start:405 stop:1028 length:624 start_codon:yes stop_codon:yes gene_type:complete
VCYGATPTLEEIRTSMDSTWQEVNSMSADVTMKFNMPVGASALPIAAVGTFDYLREDGKDKSRQRIAAKVPEPFAMEMKLDILFDGKKMYTTMELMGQKSTDIGEPSLEQGALPPGGTRLLDALEKHLDLSVEPNETIDGHEVYVLIGVPKEKDAPVQKLKICIDKAIAAQRRTEVYQLDGTVGVTVSFTNFKQNTQPDPSLFVPTK